ncbi:hypothetical protein F8M46_06200 [Lacticaseibacillus rhamnosus]|nr:hypothetical protein [Lacticaseibacillus rhamnosus]QFG48695.1 hypothetical protein F8M46_06200 [Lacticaseibacillus rhamnosus]QOX83687.1 hypothetical protein GM657_05960 [Lacticaseibacillus rhamnosus GG]
MRSPHRTSSRTFNNHASLSEREPARLETGAEAALGVTARAWPLRPRSLCAGFWAGERVMVSASRRA